MTTLKFLWIDDDLERKIHKRNLEKYEYKIGNRILKAKVDLLFLQKEEVLKKIDGFNRFSNLDLVLIDHFLSNAIGTINKGTTVAEIIREKIPKCPIIGITAAEKKSLLDQNVLSIYDDLFFIDNLDDSLSSIFNIASTFKFLNKKNIGDDLDSIVGLFKTPKDDMPILKQILPAVELDLNIKRSNVRMIARWTLHSLLSKPGLIYNKSWAANLIGIKENSFKKIEKYFEEAKYNGIFCDDLNPRWWKSKLKEIVFRISLNKIVNLPWEAGHYIPGIKKSDYSICYSCEELFPETMGYQDTTETSRLVPLHYRHSQPHPSYKSELFFDEILVMKDVSE